MSSDTAIDDEVVEMQRKIEEMEKEAEKLRSLEPSAEGAENQEDEAAGDMGTATIEADKRSIYVANVDYGSTPEEVADHFKSCGEIRRVTILVDKYTGMPKGFAYVEFEAEPAVKNALLLSDTMFRGRQLKVMEKRTNVPGMKNRFRGRGRPPMGGGAPWGAPSPWMGGAPGGGRFGPAKGIFKPKGFRPY